jgi:hypothetical protein
MTRRKIMGRTKIIPAVIISEKEIFGLGELSVQSCCE